MFSFFVPHPFSQYKVGQLVQENENDFVLRESSDSLIKIIGYGTKHPVFKNGVYRVPGVLYTDHRGIFPGDGSTMWSPMDAQQIEKLKAKLPNTPPSLKNICIQFISGKLNTFDVTKNLPLTLQNELNTYSNKPKI